jgi:hypothetical protein
MIEIPLTPSEFASRSQQLEQEQGIRLTGNEGKISKMGVTAGYRYDGSVLHVDLLEKPFFVSTEYCEEQMRKFLGA